ncbi:MAG: nickel pincer cofactor biosynthesis protein LarB [Candidatus Omnitrophica bacterium]|nr:nickel pincer cofactor biosynthesis protein LarB [Candidatus Omnitrophota bacterium]
MVTKRIIEKLLCDFKRDKISKRNILHYLENMPYKDIKFAKIDTHRLIRKGFPEVVFCQNKTPEQIIKISEILSKNRQPLLLTKLNKDGFASLKKFFPELLYNEEAKIAYLKAEKRFFRKKKGVVLIITGGTSDIAVAEEAAVTLEVMGNTVKRLYDVGVAGIHRLLDKKILLKRATVIIVVAGMEGALPSVVCGLTDKPIVAVPTSVGYGANFKGISALLTMINSCSPGIAVVNIDNGFGAGYFASLINR